MEPYEKVLLLLSIVRFIGMFLMLFGLVGFLIEILTEETMRIETTECYDRFRNEIIGLECEKEIKCGSFSKIYNEDYCYPKENIRLK